MSSDSGVSTSAQTRQYQGYPYENPPALGVPTEDPYTATRWANLPRRPIGTAVRVQEGVQDQDASSSTQSNQVERDRESNPVVGEGKQDIEDNPVVYIDIPDTTDNSICEARNHTNQINEKSPEEISYISDDEPVLYIDLPLPEESDMFERRVDTNTQNSRSQSQAKTNDDEKEPVVYIEIPECSGSGVSERRAEVDDEPSTSVVQETIFYDQFKDRRIDVMPVNSRDSDTDNSSSNNSTIRRPSGISTSAHRQRRPTSLNLWSLFTSMATDEASTSPGSSTPSQAYQPSYFIPQGYQEPYRNTPDDGFNLPPLPVTDNWDPPPAYTEIDLGSVSSNFGNTVPALTSPVLHKAHRVPHVASPVPQVSTPVSSLGSPGTTDQPRWTSFIDNENTGLDRQFLACQRCRLTVQSIVVREPSFKTHMAAISFFIIGCLPCTILVYASDWCKAKIHYCPNCSKKISKA